MQKSQKKNLQILIGVILAVLGLTGSIPLFIKEMFGYALATAVLLVIGLVLIALGFSD